MGSTVAVLSLEMRGLLQKGKMHSYRTLAQFLEGLGQYQARIKPGSLLVLQLPSTPLA